MGTNLTKLKKCLEEGDESRLLQIYLNNSNIRRKIDANDVINEQTLDTYMHVCASNGMSEFLKYLLYENKGNPNTLNRNKQTVLHKICDCNTFNNDQKQFECLELVLKWNNNNNNITNSNADLFTVNLNRNEIVNSRDYQNNTPLHYACMNNLMTCIQTLVSNGSYLSAENDKNQTPSDIAELNNNKDIVEFLESKIVFSNDIYDSGEDVNDNDDDDSNEFNDFTNFNEFLNESIDIELNCGLDTNDLQKEKDMLLVETSDVLRCTLFTAGILLKKHDWSKEKLLNSWIDDSIQCCEKCGVSVKSMAILNDNNEDNDDEDNLEVNDQFLDGESMVHRRSVRYFNKFNDPFRKSTRLARNNLKKKESIDNQQQKFEFVLDDNQQCGICFIQLDNDNCIPNLCGHTFCRSCWTSYLTLKIDEGNLGDIVCPQVDCFVIISVEKIESLVDKDTAQKYLDFDIKSFVEFNPSIKWCPHPGCKMAIKDPKLVYPNRTIGDNNQTDINIPLTIINCGNDHKICWDCLNDCHLPASCENWKDWNERIIKNGLNFNGDMNTLEYNAQYSANYLWLMTNSKNCPKCQAPIQKSEGCNHIKCYNCKNEFCWICMEGWKRHNSSTGGYFQCNRYEVSKKFNLKLKEDIEKAQASYEKAMEMNKLMHYYTRFKNHENSYKVINYFLI
jgi:ankyrin repeat and IBR domain-containing protein 1